MNAGVVWGTAGGIVGVLGGLVGTYCSVKNTAGPRERAFMIRVSVIGWFVVILFTVLMWCLHSPMKFLLWIPYAIGLPVAIRSLNRRQQEIRASEQRPL